MEMENLIDVLEDGGRDEIPIFRDAISSLVTSHPERLLNVRNQKKCEACVPLVVTACMYGEEVFRRGRAIEGSAQEIHDHIFFHKRPKAKDIPLVGPFKVPEKGFKSSFRSVFSYIITHGVSPAHFYPWVNSKSRYDVCSGGSWDGKITNREDLPIQQSQKIFIDRYDSVLSNHANDNFDNMRLPGTEEYGKLNGMLINQPLTGCIPVTENLLNWNSDEIYKVFPCEEVLGKHAVTLVGYGREGNDEYFIIQNSWGLNWGVRGYAKVWRRLLERIYVPFNTKIKGPDEGRRKKRGSPEKGSERDDMGQPTKKQHF